MKKHRSVIQSLQWLCTAVPVLLFLGYLLLSWNISPLHESFDVETVYELKTDWHNVEDDTICSDLPVHFPTNADGTATVYTTLPDYSDHRINSLLFRASQNAVRIWIGGELILEQGKVGSTASLLGKSPGSSWVLIRLPDDYAGKELRIELTSPYENYLGLLNPVFLGTRASLMFYILHTYGGGLVIALVLFLLGILLLLFSLLCHLKKISDTQLEKLGLFGILAGMWMLGESRMLQFFSSHMITWYNITMIMLHLLPIPILKLIADLPDFPYGRFCRIAHHLQLTYLSALIILQAFGICDLMEMLTVSMILLVIQCFVLPLFVYWDFFHNKNRKILSMAIAILVLSISACVELMINLIDMQIYVGYFLRFGVLAFYLVISVSAVRNALHLYMQAMQASYYKQLSYTDQMTRCKNRRDFLEKENTWHPGEGDALLMADINYLKTINDTLGHAAGDAYITACADAMQEVFLEKGDCFRLGGDEFLFWGKNMTEEELALLEQQFLQLVRFKCHDISPLCSISAGIAVFEAPDQTIADTLARADARMYEKKRMLKNEGNP